METPLGDDAATHGTRLDAQASLSSIHKPNPHTHISGVMLYQLATKPLGQGGREEGYTSDRFLVPNTKLSPRGASHKIRFI